jgi:hypothetical protein
MRLPTIAQTAIKSLTLGHNAFFQTNKMVIFLNLFKIKINKPKIG